MTPTSIAKLRRSFILVATGSFFVVILFTGLMSLVIGQGSIRRQASETIDMIIDSGGNLPFESGGGGDLFREEALRGLRFFSVSFDADGEVTDVDLSHVASVDYEQAIEIADVAQDPTSISGLGSYRTFFYKEAATDTGSIVVFLDCRMQMENARAVGQETLLVCFGALVATFLTVVIFSSRAIAPEVENARRQQQFVTNASHELKTPLSVIRANTEVTEMMSGETEWTRSTVHQVERMEDLVRNLMTIARGAEREEAEGPAAEFDATAVVGEAVESFRSRAVQSGLTLEGALDDGVTLRGRKSTLEQLACLLVDNAIKYCDAGGAVVVRLSAARIGRGCTLVVSNDYADGADVDYQRFFDRFYRDDESHENQQGYGIGLSVAESICKRYHGSIKAGWKTGIISFTCTLKGTVD